MGGRGRGDVLHMSLPAEGSGLGFAAMAVFLSRRGTAHRIKQVDGGVDLS